MKAPGGKSLRQARAGGGGGKGVRGRMPGHVRPAGPVNKGHERQAEQRGRWFVAGEEHLSQGLSAAPASSYRVPGSIGHPLPQTLRAQLEKAFDADLSAVRVHRDAPAQQAAQWLQADAFASGPALYFRGDAYDPCRPSGQALIAHEITHALQQTGRRTAGGRMQVHAVPGGLGGVQCSLRDLPRMFDTTQSLAALTQVHVSASTDPAAVTELRSFETTVSTLLGGDDLWAEHPNRQLLLDRVDAGDWSAAATPVLALLADVLRALRADVQLTDVLLIDPTMRCVLHDYGVWSTTVAALGETWLQEQLAREPLVQWFSRQFIYTFRAYLFAPRRAIQALAANDASLGDIVTWSQNTVREAASGRTTLVENELFFLALDLLRLANEERIAMLRQAEERANVVAAGANPAFRRLSVAQQLSEAFDRSAGMPMPENALGVFAVWHLVMPQLQALAHRAVSLWSSVRDALVEGQASEVLRTHGDTPIAQRFHAALANFALAVFARTAAGALPSASAYNTALRSAKSALIRFSANNVEAELIRMAGRDDAEYDAAAATWSGLILAYLPDLIAEADRYDVAADLRNEREQRPNILPEVSGRQWGADLRIEHRISLAAELYPLANALQWTDIVDKCNAVLNATDSPLGRSEIALLGDWHEQAGVTISDFAAGEEGQGFNADTPISGLGFLTPRLLANVFYTQYATLVSGAIETILVGNATQAGEEGDVSVDRPTIRSRVQGTMDSAPRPRRYDIAAGQWRLAENPDDPASVYGLVMVHPKTQRFLAREGVVMEVQHAAAAPLAVFPVHSPMAEYPLFFWSLPPLEPVVTRLREIVELDEIVRAEMARLTAQAEENQSTDPALAAETSTEPPELAPVEDDATSTSPDGPFWWRWMQAFVGLDVASIERFREPLERATQGEADQAEMELNRLWRRAWTHDRQLLVKFHLMPLMQAYRAHGVETYNHPGETLQKIFDFARRVTPRSDESYHVSLALLEMFIPPADGETDITEALSETRRFDVIVSWQSALRQAVRASGMPERVLLLDEMTAAERADLSWLDTSAARMQAVIDAMEANKAQAQLMTGILVRPQSEENAEFPAFVSLPGTREVSGENPFTINGVIYQLVSAAHTVEFHPDYGTTANLDSYTPSVLIVDGTPVEVDPETRRRTGTRELFRIMRNGRLVTVRESDDELLEEISSAVGLQAVVESLEELEAFLEWTANLAMDLAEFIPGAGQVLMATRLATAVLGFIASPEFDEIKEQVLENPTGFIDGLIELVNGELFEPDRVMGWAFLGLSPPIGAVSNPRPARPPRTRGRASSGTLQRFATLVQRLAQVGMRFGGSINRVRQRAGQSFLSLESFVQGHPMLAMGFDLIGEFAELLDPDIIAEAQRMLARAGVVMSEIQNAFLNFPEHMGELVHTLNSLEIPREIIPMDEVLEIIIRLVIERLGAKYRIAGNAILFVLDQLGLKQQLFDAIVAQLPDSANPNHYWGQFVDETLQPRLDTVRTELIAGLNRLLDQFGFPQVPENTAEDAEITSHGSEFPEAEASPAAHPPMPTGRLPSTPRGGQPLSRSLRRSAEGEFGHDFSHVRLHSGAQARPVTSGFGADGLTTGSHVYLAPHLSAEHGPGRQVLRHELGHVLQQGGPRPLARGARYRSTPVVPSRRGGVRVDDARERAADTMAHQARGGQGVAAADVGAPAANAGWAPSLSMGTVGRIVRRLARGEALMEHYRRMDPEHGGTVPGIETLPPTVAPMVADLHTELRNGVRTMTGWPAGYEQALQDQITTYYFGANRAEDLRHAVNRVARESLVQHRPRATGRAPAAGPPELRLNVRVFERGIEAYFLERGLGMRVAFHTESREGWTYLRTPDTVRSMSFAFLHMAQVGSGSPIWEDLMKNTWGTGCTRGSDLWKRYQGRTRVYLEARGAAVGLYGSPGLRLSRGAKEEIEALATEATEIDLAHLPSVDEYINATGAGSRNQGSGVLSLITGTYGDPKQTGADRGKERESHHTTQFLLIEYFSHWHTLKPFKHDLALYQPVGLTVSGDQPDTFTPATGTPINIKALAGTSMSARGRAMPVISVAAVTHRRGKLHIVGAKPDTPGDDSAPTQSWAVHLKFKSFVQPQPVYDAMFGDEAAFTAFTATPAGRTQVRTAIYTAMQSTYRWMRDDMRQRLEDGLKDVEVGYYNDLAQQAGRSERMNDGQVGPAVTAAVNKNREIMETGNHWA